MPGDENNTRRGGDQLEILLALQDVAKAELAKGPGISSNAWRRLYDAVANAFGDDALEEARPVVGRQPIVMPPGFKNPIPAKNGAVPTRPDQPVLGQGGGGDGGGDSGGDIRARADVAAEINRIKTGG